MFLILKCKDKKMILRFIFYICIIKVKCMGFFFKIYLVE